VKVFGEHNLFGEFDKPSRFLQGHAPARSLREIFFPHYLFYFIFLFGQAILREAHG